MTTSVFRPGYWRLALTGLVSTVSGVAAPAYDFFICATLNRNYVVGSKIVTTNGVFQRDATQGWAHVGYNDTTLSAVAFDPRDRQVIYTSALNGCWRSLDGGRTWQINTGWEITEARDVAVDPHAPDHVYLAFVNGVAVSTDRGQTWARREKGLPDRGKYTQTIKVDRTRAGRVLAGCELGIYLTKDGAQRWKRVLATRGTVNELQQSWHDPKIWVAVTQNDGAWASQDNGESWKQFPTVPTSEALYNIAMDPTQPQRLVIGSWAHGVLATEDGGKTWQARNAGLPEPHQVWRVGIEPTTGRLLASVVGQTLFASEDFGRTWTREALDGSRVNAFITVPRAHTTASKEK
ncbi:MAG: hypothetical protein JNN01_20705 [Opitutaceae bacterium]|nr:hypothetical protein [Opitutaceae bacterium]